MKILIKYLVLILVLTSSSLLSAGDINSISFEGLKHTNEKWLLAQLECKRGANFNEKTYQRDLQYIKDLNIFLSVEGRIVEREGGFDIVFIIKESLYFYPILTWKRASDKYKIQVGGSYDHYLGMKGKIGGIIEYYDKFSFVLYHELPLHINQRTGHFFSMSKRATIEPVKLETSDHTIEFDLYTIGGGGYYHWKPRVVSKFGVQYFKESYYTDFKESPLYNKGLAVEFNKVQVSSGMKIDKRHYKEELLSGYAIEFEGEYIKTFEFKGIDGDFFKLSGSYKYFTSFINGKDNIGCKIFFGVASNGNIPLPPFVVDNFINVRGVGDRTVRGTAIIGANIEYRRRIIKHDYFYLQGVLFSDMVSVRPRLASIDTVFDNDNLSFGSGVGLRIQMRKFYHTVLSVDYSIPGLNVGGNGGFVFGVGQYF